MISSQVRTVSGMQITMIGEEGSGAVTLLVSMVKDQEELRGIFETNYSLQQSILSVDCLEKL